MTSFNRYVGISLLLLGTCGPASRFFGRRYGMPAARRFGVGMASTLGAQQALVGVAVAGSGGHGSTGRRHRLNVVDMMTLSRGWAASLLAGVLVSGIRDRRGAAGWMGWLALLYGAILCDWLDGPIARHRGTSDVGALLDLEMDSWLTLCAAGGAVGWGNLPIMAASPPLMRYVSMFEALRTSPYADLFADEPGWVRQMGMAQMLLYIAALAPFRGPVTSRLIRLTVPLQTALQLAGLLVLHRRRSRT